MGESMKDFHVAMYGAMPDGNGGYHHPTEGKFGVIVKNNIAIYLTDEEIKKVVSAFGGTFKG
jgi:hypothetical protein